MIAWTIPHSGVLTGETIRTFVYSATFFIYNASPAGTGVASTSVYSSGQSRTIHGLTSSLTSFESASEFLVSNAGSTSYEYAEGVSPDTTLSTFSSNDEATASSASSTQGQTTAQAGFHEAYTSTTNSEQYSFYTTTLESAETTRHTTTKNNESKVEFTTVSATTQQAVPTSSNSTRTFKTITTQGKTAPLGASATVIEAEDNEIIYVYQAPSSWANYSAALSQATSATRTTIFPELRTVSGFVLVSSKAETQDGVNEGTVNDTFIGASTSSWSSERTTFASNYVTSTTTFVNSTIVTNMVSVPNSTVSIGRAAITTKTQLVQFERSSSTFSHDLFAKTTIGTRWATEYAQAGRAYDGSLSWNVLRTTAKSTTYTETRPVVVNETYKLNSSYSTEIVDPTFDAGPPAGPSTELFTYRQQIVLDYSSGHSVNMNFTARRPPACRVDPQPAYAVSVKKFVPKAAKIGSLSGGFFTLAGTTLPFSTAKDARAGLSTILPTELNSASYSGNAVSYVVESGTVKTTSSKSISLAGASTTQSASGPLGIFGGSPDQGETFANGVNSNGVFKNLVNGQTTVLLAGETTFTQSQVVSKMTAAPVVLPPSGSGGASETTIYWTAPRNSSNLPPAMTTYAA